MGLVLDPSSTGEVGVPAGRELLNFANAVEWNDDVASRRSDLLDAVGTDGLLEAAATIGIFNGLIRVADGTGIQLDDGLKEASAEDRQYLDLNLYHGAANTPNVGAGPSSTAPLTDVAGLFN